MAPGRALRFAASSSCIRRGEPPSPQAGSLAGTSASGRQAKPLPLTIVSMSMEVEIGG